MRTVLIDIEGNICSFKPLGPLFYPLLRRGDLQCYTAGSSSGRQCETADEAAQWLKLNRQGESWQAIFLTCSRNNTGDISYSGCMSDRIDRLKTVFLDSWHDVGLIPEHVWIVSIDPWQLDGEGAPSDCLGRYHAELDLKGYVGDAREGDLVFSDADIARVAGGWRGKFDLTGVPDNAGIDEVGSVKAEIEDSFKKAADELGAIITIKKNNIGRYAPDEKRRFLNSACLDDLQRDFRERLTNRLEMRGISWLWASVNPFSELLAQSLAQTYGAVAAASRLRTKIACIHILAPEWHRECVDINGCRCNFLKIFLFILWLIERGKDATHILRPSILWSASVEIDLDEFGETVHAARDSWRVFCERLEKELKEADHASSLVFFTPPPPGEPESFDEPTPNSIGSVDTVEGWGGLIGAQGRGLDEGVRIAEEKLCDFRRRLQENVGQEPMGQIDVEVKARALSDEADQLRKDITASGYEPITHEWPDCVHADSQYMLQILASIPSLHQKLLLFVSSGLVLIGTYLVAACKEDGWSGLQKPGVYLPAIIFLGVLFFSDVTLMLFRWVRKNMLLKKIKKEFKAQAENISILMKQNGKYLWKVAKLAVVTQNQHILDSAINHIHEEKTKKRYFLDSLRVHYASVEPYDNAPENTGRETSGGGFYDGLLLDRPEEFQKMFCIQRTGDTAYQVSSDGATYNWKSSYLPGLKKIILKSKCFGLEGM